MLDRDLPAVHGDEVCARLVTAGGRSRVLMLTGASEDEDLVDGLGLGADDCLSKPFAFAVLVARIGALALWRETLYNAPNRSRTALTRASPHPASTVYR